MRDKHAILKVVEYEDVAQELPEVEPFSCSYDSIDLFICALGFEDRALAIPIQLSKSLNEKAPFIERGIVCTYTTNFEENEEKRADLEAALRKICEKKVEVPGDIPGN